MSDPTTRFIEAIRLIDAANAQDPHGGVDDVGGATAPSELIYSRRMTRRLAALYPSAGEALQLAARAQHIRRWMIPRDSFPMDRVGYLRWRTTLYTFHADEAEKIMRSVGYDDALIDRVRSLLRKERIKSDPDAQALEDTICLVFLQNYFSDFSPKHADDKVIHILRRTWAKMSPVGQAAALQLDMTEPSRRLVAKALGK